MPPEIAIMDVLELWKLCVLETARLFLQGAEEQELRKVVKHLNIILNTELVFDPAVSRAMALLEAITFQIHASFDHHGDRDILPSAQRLNLIQLQLKTIRRP